LPCCVVELELVVVVVACTLLPCVGLLLGLCVELVVCPLPFDFDEFECPFVVLCFGLTLCFGFGVCCVDDVVVTVWVGPDVEHGSSVSPCARCADTAGAPTVIVTIGFVFECVW
jgi:hypothetical protein